MKQPTVLIIADDVDFSRMLISRWQSERLVPAFTVVAGNVWQASGDYDVAVIGSVDTAPSLAILGALEANAVNSPAICVCKDHAALQQVREAFPRILAVRQH
jgi:hypothetical protein